MRTALAAAAVLFAAQSARAEPFSPGKAATISAALTTTGVTAGAVLFFGAAQRGRRAGMVAGLAIGGGSLIFAPSFSRLAQGQWSSGLERISTRLLLCAGTLGAVAATLDVKDQFRPNRGTYTAVAIGLSAIAGHAIWDIATAARGARESRYSVSVATLAQGRNSGPALLVRGAF